MSAFCVCWTILRVFRKFPFSLARPKFAPAWCFSFFCAAWCGSCFRVRAPVFFFCLFSFQCLVQKIGRGLGFHPGSRAAVCFVSFSPCLPAVESLAAFGEHGLVGCLPSSDEVKEPYDVPLVAHFFLIGLSHGRATTFWLNIVNVR